mgnify:CR=1 FL=1
MKNYRKTYASVECNQHQIERLLPKFDLLCEELQIDSETLKKRLAEIDYEYDPEQNRFI